MPNAPDFLPEYWYLPVGGGYVPAYRLFTGKQLHIVPGNQPMATAGQAMAVAREYVRQRLNSPVQACTVEPEAELDEIERWRRKKADEAAAEKAKVFGSAPMTPRNASGSTVAVEYRNRRARA